MENTNKYSDIFNINFIQEENNTNTKHKHHKSKKSKIIIKNNKNNNLDNKKNIEKEENEKKIEIKLINFENDLLMKRLIEKENILKDYKIKCKKQEEKIIELRNKIFEINNKNKNKNKRKSKNEDNINYINIDDNNDDLEKEIDLKEIESRISQDLSFRNESNKNISILNEIETIKFDINNAEFYQCGICMDSFQNEEKVKKLFCGHIYHKECLNQWIQNNNKCPFCEETIYHK